MPSLLLVDGSFTAYRNFSQTAAAAIIDRDYNDNLRRLVSNIKKHISAGDDPNTRTHTYTLAHREFRLLEHQCVESFIDAKSRKRHQYLYPITGRGHLS